MINIENLSFYYNDNARPSLSALNLSIPDGQYVVITGPSGSGKSSLGRCLNGLIPHFYGGTISGRVEVQGLEVLQHSTREMATRIGMVFQDPENQLIATDVERELAFGLENLALPENLIARRIEEALDSIGIAALRHRPIQDLSGGEKQKVAIASVMALHPDILVLDEPTSQLDPQSAEDVLSIIKRLNDELGLTVILIEHRLDRVLPHADRIILLEQGKIAADDTTARVLTNCYDKLVELGIGLPPLIRLARKLNRQYPGINCSPPLTNREGRQLLDKIISQTTCLSREKAPVADLSIPIIKVEKLWYAYPAGPVALRNISLTIRRGEFVAVMGRNSSGKTTLLKLFNGLLKPGRGKVSVEGIDTGKTTTAALAHKIGLLSQNPNDHLFADTVEEEISFALNNLGFARSEIHSRLDQVIDQFGLSPYRKSYPRSLSGGERQRIALASVVAVRPQILILDEPTRGLEYHLKNELMRFLAAYAQLGHTVILVTHDVEIAAEYASRVILLSEGEVIVDGNTHAVLSGALLFSPQINRLIQPYRKYGIPPDILTVEELLGVLKC